MFKAYRVQLKPNKKQISLFKHYSNAARCASNWGIERQQKARDNKEKFITAISLGKEFRDLIYNNEGYSWIKDVPPTIYRQAFKDLNDAYQKFFKIKGFRYPKFKSKNIVHPTFFQRGDRIYFKDKYVVLTKIGKVRIKESNYVPDCRPYYNTRISFDGLNWWLSTSIKIVDCEDNQKIKTEPLGIDLGIKTYVTLSNGEKFENINKFNLKIKKLNFKISKIRRYIDKAKNKGQNNSNNIIKLKKELIKLYKRITNIRYNYIFQIINYIIKKNPEYIVIEDLDLIDLRKRSNKNLRKMFREASFYKFKTHLEYKCKINGIPLYKADKFYPSSKMCSNCGHKKNSLTLNDRIYICEKCGLKIDRDLNAAINLKNYIVE